MGLSTGKQTLKNKFQNEMLEGLLEIAPLAITALDLDGNVVFYNLAAERLLGWDKESIIGRRYPFMHPTQINEIKVIIRSCHAGETLPPFITRRLHKNGHYIDVKLSTAPLRNTNGELIGYMAVMEDIGESKMAKKALRQSEKNYRTIFDAANDAIFVFNVKNGAILDVNQRMLQMYGYSYEKALRLTIDDLSAGDSSASYHEFMRHIWDTRTDELRVFEWLAKHSSEGAFWTEVTMRGVVIGDAYRVLASVHDISNRKKAEQENKIMQERLFQANKMAAIGTLASGIAHEINNPNNCILSNAQLLSELWPDIGAALDEFTEDSDEFYLGKLEYKEAKNYIPRILSEITEGSCRIKGIVSGLKDFARQEEARVTQQVDINKVIDASLGMLAGKIKKHTHNFKCSLSRDIPCVPGSFRRLEQVVVNLVMNALEALPNKDCGVTLITSYAENPDFVIMEVVDEGCGMSENVRKAIFDPFFTTKLDKGGTGLGLSIIFNIVKDHKGFIECHSKPGEGTIFRVKIPVAQKKGRREHKLR